MKSETEVSPTLLGIPGFIQIALIVLPIIGFLVFLGVSYTLAKSFGLRYLTVLTISCGAFCLYAAKLLKSEEKGKPLLMIVVGGIILFLAWAGFPAWVQIGTDWTVLALMLVGMALATTGGQLWAQWGRKTSSKAKIYLLGAIASMILMFASITSNQTFGGVFLAFPLLLMFALAYETESKK